MSLGGNRQWHDKSELASEINGTVCFFEDQWWLAYSFIGGSLLQRLVSESEGPEIKREREVRVRSTKERKVKEREKNSKILNAKPQ